MAKHLNDTTIEFRDTMRDLNDSLGIVKVVELNEKQNKQLQKYADLISALGQKISEDIDIPDYFKKELDDTKELRLILQEIEKSVIGPH